MIVEDQLFMDTNRNKYTILILLFILLLAGYLRLNNLANYPPLNADEAAIGYNGWSLLETGKDEHGNSWPIHFVSFGDYKPGGYFYVVLPFLKIIGLNELAVRLPSALAGLTTIYLVFLLSKLMWRDEKLGLFWAMVLTISPWHIHFSRGGWESNFSLFLVVLGTYLFMKRIILRKQDKILPSLLVVLPFIFAMYTYHSARIIAPLLGIGLAVLNYKSVLREKKTWFISLLVAFILLVPLLISFLGGGASSRFSGVGLFADKGPLNLTNELRAQHANPMGPISRIYHNRYTGYGIFFMKNYFSHFNGDFLFIGGDEVPRSRVPELGLMYLVEGLFIVLGVCFWLKDKNNYKLFPLVWLLVAPLASALTFQAPSALRSLPLTIPLTFFVAYGLKKVYELRIKTARSIFLLVIAIAYLWSFLGWRDSYFNHYLKRFPAAWPGGFSELAKWLNENGQKYENVYVTDKYDQPYILFLYYLKYSPEKIQEEITLTASDKFGFSTVRKFDKYCFGLDKCGDWDGKENVLVIASDEVIDGTIIKEIYTSEGNKVFRVIEVSR